MTLPEEHPIGKCFARGASDADQTARADFVFYP